MQSGSRDRYGLVVSGHFQFLHKNNNDFTAKPTRFSLAHRFFFLPSADSLLDQIMNNPGIAQRNQSYAIKFAAERILKHLAGGDTMEDDLKEFPDLQKEDLQTYQHCAVLHMKQNMRKFK